MRTLLLFTFCSILFFSCNNHTESAQEENNTTGTAPNVINDRSTDTSMMNNKSRELSESMEKMMKEMKAMSPSGNTDNDFAMMMMIHHQGAVDMSQVELKEGKSPEMQAMAKHIDSVSRKEIAELDSFLTKTKPSGNTQKSDFAEKAMQLMDSSSVMRMTHSGNLDDDFSEMMIKHHEDGIAMAKLYLKTGKHPNTKKIANAIVRDQPKEIKQLQSINQKVK